jgi:hypothetical protein
MVPDQVNRTIIVIWGVIFAAGGGVLLAMGAGAAGSGLAGQPVITKSHFAFITGHQGWSWGIIGAVGAVLVAVGVWWLIAQLRITRGMRSLEIEPDRGSGRATVPTRLLSAAVAADLDQTPGMEQGRARLVRRRGRPELELRAKLNPHADIHAARRHIEGVVIPHAREALAPQPLPARVTVELARSR